MGYGDAQVAGADDRNRPFLIDLQHGLQPFDEIGYLVARALLAKAAKVRKVFANLRRTDVQSFAQFVRRGNVFVVLLQAAQGAQIKRQSADNNVRDCFRRSYGHQLHRAAFRL